MASKTSTLFLYLMPIFLIISSSTCDEKHLVFYLQETAGGPNAMLVVVAGVNGTSSTFRFGTVIVFDDSVTEGPERSSTVLGRAQGVLEGISSTALHLDFSVVFEKGIYNGSSLQVQGAATSFLTPREFSIVGGTGLFRYAHGFVIATTIASTGFHFTFKYNATLQLD